MSKEIGKRNESPLKETNKKNGKILFLLIVFFAIVLTIFFLPRLLSSGKNEKEQEKVAEISIKTKTFAKPKKAPQKTKEQFVITPKKEIQEEPIVKIDDVIEKKAPPRASKTKGGALVVNNASNEGNKDSEETVKTDNLKISDDISLANVHQKSIFSAPKLKNVTARKNKTNPHLAIGRGTYIPCVLNVRLVSDLEGQTTCIIAENVYSKRGSVLLIERGSIAKGYYKGNVKNKQIAVIWQEIETPNNITIDLDSPSVGVLGANGLFGDIDTHFWKRFKDALLVTILNTGIETAFRSLEKNTKKKGGDDEGFAPDNSVMNTLLQQLPIHPPTLYKNQGEKIGILVARELDFSKVYKLKLKK